MKLPRIKCHLKSRKGKVAEFGIFRDQVIRTRYKSGLKGPAQKVQLTLYQPLLSELSDLTLLILIGMY